MLPKERRISKDRFQDVLKSATKRNSQHFLLYMAINKDEIGQKSRFSFSISKKVAKTAVLRNKLRRRGYSIVGRLLNEIPENRCFVFVLKKGAEKQAYKDLEREIVELIIN